MTTSDVFGRPRRVLALLAATAIIASHVMVLNASSVNAQSTSFTFNGGGWGHGLGMSQFGAKGYAEVEGLNAEQILGRYYTGASLVTEPQPKNVRIHLRDSNTIGLSAAKPMTMRVPGASNQPFIIGTEATLARDGEYITVSPNPFTPGAGPARLGGSGLHVVLDVTAECPGCNPVRLSSTGNRYARGKIQFRPKGNDQLRAIATNLTMDDYLLGLGEVPSSWPEETLKAQAIAARSYARNKINNTNRGGGRFDLYSSTYDQVYLGWDKEAGQYGYRWKAAVEATKNQTMNYEGSAIEALYSSSTGGHTENSENVFTNSLPYLRGVDDPHDAKDNPYGSWTRNYTQGELSRWLARSDDTNVGQVTGFELLTGTGVSGRIDKSQVRINGTNGSKTVSGTRLRRAINNAVTAEGGSLGRQLLSTKVTVPNNVGPGGSDTGGSGGSPKPTADEPFGGFQKIRKASGGRKLVLQGWAIDPGRPNANIGITIDGKPAGRAWTQFQRNDIKNRHGGNGKAGFARRIRRPAKGAQICISVRDAGINSSHHIACRAAP